MDKNFVPGEKVYSVSIYDNAIYVSFGKFKRYSFDNYVTLIEVEKSNNPTMVIGCDLWCHAKNTYRTKEEVFDLLHSTLQASVKKVADCMERLEL